MAKKGAETGEITNLTFEQAFKELQSIVERLENGDVTLDEAIELYEKGMKLSKYCMEKLVRAELRIKKISKSEDKGFELFDFDDFNESGL